MQVAVAKPGQLKNRQREMERLNVGLGNWMGNRMLRDFFTSAYRSGVTLDPKDTYRRSLWGRLKTSGQLPLPPYMAPYLARNNVGGLTLMTRSVLIWTKDHMWQYPIDSVAFGVIGKKSAVADLKNGYGVMLDVRPAMKSKDYLAGFNAAADAALRDWKAAAGD